LSLLALGHKHSLGIDQVPQDYDIAFCNFILEEKLNEIISFY